jgi:hypothetical protein
MNFLASVQVNMEGVDNSILEKSTSHTFTLGRNWCALCSWSQSWKGSDHVKLPSKEGHILYSGVEHVCGVLMEVEGSVRIPRKKINYFMRSMGDRSSYGWG